MAAFKSFAAIVLVGAVVAVSAQELPSRGAAPPEDIHVEALVADGECRASGGESGQASPSCGLSALQLRRSKKTSASEVGEHGQRVERRFFVWISDIHMDPYWGVNNSYGSDAAVCMEGCHGSSNCTTCRTSEEAKEHPLGMMGCDPPMSLWKSAVAAAARAAPGAEFVVFSGDFTRHGQDKMPDPYANVTTIIGGTARALVEEFDWLEPNQFILGTLGNDDSPKDYELNITDGEVNPWLGHIGASLRDASAMSRDREDAYSIGGFFETEVGGIRVISIDTLMYSTRHTPMEPVPADPFGQFAWLRGRLEAALREKRRVWIVGHIPPGTETFGFTPLWRPLYLEAYLEIVQDPELGNVVAAQLFGHVHADEMRFLPNAPSGAGPVLLTGAVSPIFHSNPSFRLVEYDQLTGNLLNVKVFYAVLPSSGDALDWQFGYDMRGAYPSLGSSIDRSGGLTNAAIGEFVSSLEQSWASDGRAWSTYAEWYKTRYANDLQCASDPDEKGPDGLSEATKRRYLGKYLCGLTISTPEGFDQCAGEYSLSVVVLPEYSQFATPGLGLFYRQARMRHWSSVATAEEQVRLDKACSRVAKEA